jgi:hypothetical protein
MKTNINHLKNNFLKASLIFFIILVGELQSCMLMAQGLKQLAKKYQFGFEGSFGIKSFTLSSNIAKIDGLNVIEEGGAIGVVAGTRIARVRIRQGFYYSSSDVTQTVDEMRSSFGINVYPLQFFTNNARLLPYITMSMERNIFKMHGFYGEDASARHNYSVSQAPYLGKITTIQSSIGAGLEYRMKVPGHFITFFAEARYGKNVSTQSSTALFNGTAISDQIGMNVGISYGYSR